MLFSRVSDSEPESESEAAESARFLGVGAGVGSDLIDSESAAGVNSNFLNKTA